MTLPSKGFKSGHGVILTHGAGGDMNYEHLKVLAKYLAENDMACLRFTCKPTVMKTRITAMTAVLVRIYHA